MKRLSMANFVNFSPMQTLDPAIPGSDLVTKGLADLAKNERTNESLLIHITHPALRFVGVEIPPLQPLEKEAKLILYDRLCESHDNGAHSAYNALVRRVDSFCRTFPRAP
jgi:hypothetical protein